jgi:hypothetical protein
VSIITHVETVTSVLSAGAGLYAVWQAGRWRRSDEWKVHQKAVSDISEKSKLLEQRVCALEGDVRKLPTAADIARVEGAIGRVESEVQSAAAGVDRIEGLLLKHALESGAGR